MNKVYSLKYSHITGGLIAVSELTRRITTGSRKKTISYYFIIPDWCNNPLSCISNGSYKFLFAGFLRFCTK
ncbi:TPA: ESPR domain-containing protein [Escherichia coli]|nr:ESPR domain-containing protein [Escherichia coli]